jgi:hypothetical protein
MMAGRGSVPLRLFRRLGGLLMMMLMGARMRVWMRMRVPVGASMLVAVRVLVVEAVVMPSSRAVRTVHVIQVMVQRVQQRQEQGPRPRQEEELCGSLAELPRRAPLAYRGRHAQPRLGDLRLLAKPDEGCDTLPH